jgi:recombination protein RecT
MASTTPQKSSSAPASGQALAKRDPKQEKTQQLATLIESRKATFALVAGAHFKPERLVKLAQGALARNPKIAECTPASVLVALLRCAELELEPDSALPQRRMWLVPRWNKRLNANELTYIIDYRAQIQKARESGIVKSIIASEVRKNDYFVLGYDVDGASITKFEFGPGGDGGPFVARGDVIGYFAAARLDGGEVQVAAMSKADAEAFRDKRAQKMKDGSIVGPWHSDFDAMAVKTCLRKLWNLLPAGKNEAARKLQETAQTEEDIEHGRSVQSTAPIELDLGVPTEQLEATSDQVEKALGAGSPPAGPPADDVSFETAEEQKAREEQEAKAKAAELAATVGRAAERAREPGEDEGEDEFAQR